MAKQKKSLSDLSKVELINEKGRKSSFPYPQAMKMLSMASRGKGSWKLVDDQLEYSKENGIRVKPSQGATESSKESENDSEG